MTELKLPSGGSISAISDNRDVLKNDGLKSDIMKLLTSQ